MNVSLDGYVCDRMISASRGSAQHSAGSTRWRGRCSPRRAGWARSFPNPPGLLRLEPCALASQSGIVAACAYPSLISFTASGSPAPRRRWCRRMTRLRPRIRIRPLMRNHRPYRRVWSRSTRAPRARDRPVRGSSGRCCRPPWRGPGAEWNAPGSQCPLPSRASRAVRDRRRARGSCRVSMPIPAVVPLPRTDLDQPILAASHGSRPLADDRHADAGPSARTRGATP